MICVGCVWISWNLIVLQHYHGYWQCMKTKDGPEECIGSKSFCMVVSIILSFDEVFFLLERKEGFQELS